MKLLKSFASIGSSVKKVDYKKFTANTELDHNIIIHFDNDKSVQIVAIGDCCSISYIVKLKGMPFSKLNNKVIKSIKEIKNKQKIKNAFVDIKPYHFANDPLHDHIINSFHLYEIKLDNGDQFYFGMINASSGYYDGWLEIYLL